MSRCPSGRLAAAALFAAALAAPPLPAATIFVDTVSDADVDDPFCSLREAILAANLDVARHGCEAGSGGDRIEFQLPPGSTILGSVVGLPTITDTLVIAGPGSDDLTIDGADLQPLLHVDSPAGGAGLQVEDLTLARGNAFTVAFNRGGAATVAAGDFGVFRRVVFRENSSDLGGGALLALGAPGAPALVTVEDCLFEGNQGLAIGGGAILAARATLTVSRSTFTANTTPAEPSGAQARGGGAIFAQDSTVAVRTSTITGNSTAGSGGAVLAFSAESSVPDLLVITDSTLVGNFGDTDGDDLGNVGGVAMAAIPGDPATLEVHNSIFADNDDFGTVVFPDLLVSGLGVVSHGYNLVAANPGVATWFPTGNPNGNGDYVGTLAAPLAPALASLGDFGGPTPVRLPIPGPGSLVIDRGQCALAGSDQRGYVDAGTGSRPVDDPLNPAPAGGDHCDIGAAESGAVAPPELPFLDGFENGTTSRWSSTVP
jgi:CSLREA domain-containing protein